MSNTLAMKMYSILTILAFFSYYTSHGITDPTDGNNKGNPISSILNPDGTLALKSGFTGSFDPSGYRMISNPGEAPRFVPIKAMAADPDDAWFTNFKINGVPKSVNAVAISGSDVYVGGVFTTAGGIPANYIAKWDGASWSALGTGLNGPVSSQSIVISGTDTP